jgi:hypothetical protein
MSSADKTVERLQQRTNNNEHQRGILHDACNARRLRWQETTQFEAKTCEGAWKQHTLRHGSRANHGYYNTRRLRVLHDRLHETLCRLTSLDDETHELLNDSEYDADLQKCEEYIESAKRAILRTSREMESCLSNSTANVTITNAGKTAATVTPFATTAVTRIPPIKLEQFSGDIETWARFGSSSSSQLTNFRR